MSTTTILFRHAEHVNNRRGAMHRPLIWRRMVMVTVWLLKWLLLLSVVTVVIAHV
jgi:hypothetical protein